MPVRRRHTRRARARRGGRRLAILLLFIAAGIASYGLWHHVRISGTPARQIKHVARLASPLPAASAARTGRQELSPSPSPSPAATASPARGGAKLAIIIDDCGYSLPHDEQFLKLPIPVTLSILPMTPHARDIAAAAAAAGKAIILHLPMEPEVAGPHADPGPGAITTAMSDAQVQAQVEADLAALPAVPGANNHMGSKATSDPRVMRDVLDVFKRDNLFFIDSMTSPASVGFSTARELGVPTAARDVFLDNQATLSFVEEQLRNAQAVALRQGSAIAIGHPNAATAQALAAMIPEIQAAGVTFVPVEQLAR